MEKRVYDLQENMAQSGCFLCRMLRIFEERYLDTLFYENVNDPAIRASLRDQGGFCPDHIQTIFRLKPSILGISLLYHDLTRTFLHHHRKWENHCPLCTEHQSQEQSLREALIGSWSDLKPAWGAQAFLCLKHLDDLAWPEKMRQELESLTRRSLETITGHLSSFIRSFDFQSAQGPANRKESLSWQEVLEFFGHTFLRKTSS